MHHRYDIVVIGAGPAGCAAALSAAGAGARVCVLDRARFPRDKTCGDAVSNRAAAVVDELVGEHQRLRTIPHAVVRGASAILPDGARIDRDFGDDPGYIVPRFHLDATLREPLEARGVDVFEGVRVRALSRREPGGFEAIAEEGRWSGDAVVAADGPGSVGWAALDAPYRRGISLGVAITAYFEGVSFGDADGLTEHYFEPGLRCGYGWIFPDVEGRANVGVYQRQDRYRGAVGDLRGMLERFIAAHPERFDSARRVTKNRSWALPLASRVIPPLGAPGLLLAGDSAYSVDPLSGEGIFQALYTGRAAGEIAARSLAEGGLDASWVRRYRASWVRELGATSLTRLAVQEAMGLLVETGAYRWPIVRRLLRRGYQSERFELSKRLH